MSERIAPHIFRFETIILILLAVVLVLAIWGWSKAANAQTRVNSLELQRQAEEVANAQGKKIGDVVTCFSTARTRPVVIHILRTINSSEENPIQRLRVAELIGEYASATVPGVKGKPNRIKCIALAKRLGINYTTYDFDPRTGALLHPPREG